MKLIYNNSSYFIINDNNEKEQIEKYGLKLSEIEEAIYGYSVEKRAKYHYEDYRKTREFEDGFMLGFQIAHQELVKDKLFTIEDVKQIFGLGAANNAIGNPSFEEAVQSLLPKTEWNVELVNNKIKLI